ncbi:hypothetical protein B0H10DRAFT_2020188 [Mycena sp. CBHHK59/15]|nr:hypothetical protein B0H10DRAFT_2020188 [Mycena sp. CBHHK59/15]
MFAEVITLKKLSIAANTLSAITDIVISVVLIYLLHSSKTGFRRTTDLMNRLIVFTFNTGLPTSFSALLATISIAIWPNTFLYIFFFLLLGRLYTNSILVTLNCREYIREANNKATQDSYTVSASESAPRYRNPQTPQRDRITVLIETDTVVDNDRKISDIKI